MKFKQQKRFITAAFGIVLALVFQLVILPISQYVPVVFAENTSEITLTNSNFNQSPSSYYLDSNPSGWTKIHANAAGTSGIINTNDDKFSNYADSSYKLPSNPQTMYKDPQDTKILMINARKDKYDTSSIIQGYRSSQVSLAANSYYSISVLVKTEQIRDENDQNKIIQSAYASIYLNGFEDDIETTVDANATKFELINAPTWQEYKFFIKTGLTEQAITIDLYLGSVFMASSNAVFFDNVKVLQLSEKYYTQQQTTNQTTKTIEYKKHYIDNIITNADFESGNMNGWTAIDHFPINSIQRVINTTQPQIMTSEGFAFLDGDNTVGSNALWLASKGTHTEFGVKSTDFTIERFGYYRVSVNVKVDQNTTAQVAIVENDDVKNFFENAGIEDDIYSYQPAKISQKITSNSSKTLMNNYNTYEFYLQGHPLFDTTAHIELSLVQSDDQTQVKGSALFDSITVELINGKIFNNANDSSTVKKHSFTTVTEQTLVQNGTFNSVANDKTINTFPVAPANWTSTIADSAQNVVGIVNTNHAHYEANKSKYGNLSNPGNPAGFNNDTTKESNNILMLWNKTQSYQSIESDKVSLTADKYYQLTFHYKNIQEGINLNVSVINQDGVKIFEQEYLPFSTWTKYTLTIRSSMATGKLSVRFSLGTQNKPTAGFAFIDNVEIKELTDMTQETFEAKLSNQNAINRAVDASLLLWNTRLLPNQDGTYALDAFATNLENGTQSPSSDPIAYPGVIDGQSNNFGILASPQNNNTIKNIYFIHTLSEATYSITSKSIFALTGGSKYKFTAFIRTNLAQVDQDYKPAFGASFSIEGIDAKIDSIKTNNEWQEVSIVVNATTNIDVQVKFALVSQHETAGIMYVDNLSITNLSNDEYATYVKEFEKGQNSNLLIVGSTNIETEEPEEPTDEKADFNWLIVPSLLTGLALVIAVAATVLRRVSFKKWSKKRAAEYDRKKTLYRDVIRKEAEQRRDEEIQKQNQALAEIQKQLDELEAQNKQRLQEQRQTKGKTIDKEVEKQFKTYATRRTKLENQKQAIVDTIKNLNSAEYLLSLQKKIQQEQLKKLQEQPANNQENK